MSITKFLFKQIDYWGYLPQNTYHDKNAIKLLKNQVYCDKYPKQCILDIYCKKGSECITQPVFVNIHGGGFVSGDKKYRHSFSQYCTKFGVKVLNINYSLAPKHNLMQILDGLTAIFDWINQNSEKLCLERKKIILCGDSAGAYLAMWLWALANNKQLAKAVNFDSTIKQIDFVENICGMVFFSGIFYPTQSLDKKMLLDINYSLWEYLCGEKFVDINTCKQNKLFDLIDIGNYLTKDFPPTFISHSEKDIFCSDNGDKLARKLDELQVPYYEVKSTNNIHDWQEMMFTKSSKLTLAHFDKFMTELLQENIASSNSITISKGKIKQNN